MDANYDIIFSGTGDGRQMTAPSAKKPTESRGKSRSNSKRASNLKGVYASDMNV